MPRYALVLDVGTTGIKAFVFDGRKRVVAKVYRAIKKSAPKQGWVEQNPQRILSISRTLLRQAVKKSGVALSEIVGLGMTNQRETVVAWDKKTGRALYPAIVWEDERTAAACRRLARTDGAVVRGKTGLPLLPYFSASKMHWLLAHVPGVRASQASGRLAFGTVDSWLLWHLLDGHPFLTDFTNASRTLLFNMRTTRWDSALLKLFGIDAHLLPEVRPSMSFFGKTTSSLFGRPLPLIAVCGDQQSSLFAAGTAVGTTKATFGTGSFLLQVAGRRFVLQDHFFTTRAASASTRPVYALESRIPFYGAMVQAALGSPNMLARVLRRLARETAKALGRFRTPPDLLVIDGGVTRDPRVAPLLAAATHCDVVQQPLFDGTALGVAKMVLGDF
jgi:glycerol kinase